jgi:hypothetical protein
MAMRIRRIIALCVFSALLVGLFGAAVAAADGRASRHTSFEGLYFPAGMEGTDTECPGVIDPGLGLCVLEPGEQTPLANGKLRIRGLQGLSVGLSWDTVTGEEEPRKTGLDHVTANVSLDATLSGPMWGTWTFTDFDGNPMFEGRFAGRFINGVPQARFVGDGVGVYEGQLMIGDIGPEADPYNMTGRIFDLGS